MLTIVFDLDGTLIDTAPDLISTLNLILAGEGLPPVAYNDGRRMIGGGILGMIERALNAEGHYPPKPEIDGYLLQQSAFRATNIDERTSSPDGCECSWGRIREGHLNHLAM